jgi:hypothetical protein
VLIYIQFHHFCLYPDLRIVLKQILKIDSEVGIKFWSLVSVATDYWVP